MDDRTALSFADRANASLEELRLARDRLFRQVISLVVVDVLLGVLHVLIHHWVRWLAAVLGVLCTFCVGVCTSALGTNLLAATEWRAARDEHLSRALGDKQ